MENALILDWTMHFDVVYLKASTFYVGSGGVDRLLQGVGFTRKPHKHLPVTADNYSVFTTGAIQGVALVVGYVGNVRQH